jgi:hypothetical protein
MAKRHCVVHMSSPIFGVETTFLYIEIKRQFMHSHCKEKMPKI